MFLMLKTNMENIQRLLWIMLITSLVVFFSLEFAFGEDKIETLRYVHKDNPTVCIMEPSPIIQERFHEEILDVTISSIKAWEIEMIEHTGGNWYLPIKYYMWEFHFDKLTTDFKQCNIIMEFDEYNNGENRNKRSLGWTAFDFSNSSHKYAYMKVYVKATEPPQVTMICVNCDEGKQNPDTEYELKPLPLGTIKSIIMHEFSHTLGVGHYIDDRTHFNNIPSLMYPTLSPFIENDPIIGLVEKEVLRLIYGEDGFGGHYGVIRQYSFDIKITDNGFFLK